MANFNPQYRKLVENKNVVKNTQITRGKFYLIKEYLYADGEKGKFQETTAPIIFVLFVSRAKDILHAVKISGVNPEAIRRFFGKFVNKETENLQMRGNAEQIYEKIVSKSKLITKEAYRTYKLSGITKVVELTMDVNELTPKSITVKGIDKRSQKKNI
jgi:hypothetical protein